jgi:hypothetical protein
MPLKLEMLRPAILRDFKSRQTILANIELHEPIARGIAG